MRTNADADGAVSRNLVLQEPTRKCISLSCVLFSLAAVCAESDGAKHRPGMYAVIALLIYTLI
ncbi:MAG: hypothetical protein WED05_08935 [Candidatus Atabeyarchaeum deiterrae]